MTEEDLTQILVGKLEIAFTKIKDTKDKNEQIKLGERLIDIIRRTDNKYQSFTNGLMFKGLISQKEDIGMVHNYCTVPVYILLKTERFIRQKLAYDEYIHDVQDDLEQIRRMRMPMLFGKLKGISDRNNIDYSLLLENFSTELNNYGSELNNYG